MAKRESRASRRRPLGLIVLHEDDDIIVVDKPPGLLTMGTEREKERTAYYALTDYVRKGAAKSRNRIFIVHRLDRDVSGVLVFAKTFEAKERLQGHWDAAEKKYLAVVHGVPDAKEGTISSHLAENSAHVVFSTQDPARGKLSHTAYRVLKETKDFSLLEITLLTGRKNQIRVHLSDIRHPIVGDAKYGGGSKPHLRVALHAVSLTLDHPRTGNRMTFRTGVPAYLARLAGGFDYGADEPAPGG